MSRLLIICLLLLITCELCLSGCAAKEKPQTPEDYLRLGDQELGQKRDAQARKYYTQLIEQYPDSDLKAQAEEHIKFLRQRLAEHEFAVGRFYYRKGAYHAAIGRFLNLIQVYPDTPDIDAALYMLADSYHAEENYVKAHGVLQLLMERFP